MRFLQALACVSLLPLLAAFPRAPAAHDLAGIGLERKNKEQADQALKEQFVQPAPKLSNLPQLKVLEDKRQAIALLGRTSDANSLAYALNRRMPGIDSIFNDHLAWLPATTLTVCFSTPGNEQVKKAVVDTAQVWTQYANIKFNFGAAPKYTMCKSGDGKKIRITLEATGNSSLVGTEAEGHDRTNTDTMFFSRIDTELFNTPRFRWLVLHEFGHALGLQHEHQHPSRNCIQQLNVEAISAAFGWSSEDAQKNLARIEVSSASQSSRFFTTGMSPAGAVITYSDYDPTSVMHYDIDARYFRTSPPGNCWVDAVQANPSPLDQQAVARAYPAGSAVNYVRKYNSMIEQTIRASGSLTPLQQQALRTLKKAQ